MRIYRDYFGNAVTWGYPVAALHKRGDGMKKFGLALLMLGGAALAGGGCSGGPSPPKWPELKPADVAHRAMEQYDANHDGKIDAQEIKKSPALEVAAATMDPGREGFLTEAKIADRVSAWRKSPGPVMTQLATVLLDDKPLDGATVTFEPEKFMGPAYHPTSAVTTKAGNCSPPGDDPEFPGLHLGLYQVTISKKVAGQETIPASYNTQTTLGVEIAPDAPGANSAMVFRLKSK